MAEVLASLKKIGGNGEQYTETVLWTNPSPSSNFAAQTITLSDSLSNYKYIGIRFKIHNTHASTPNATGIMLVSEFVQNKENTGTDRRNILIASQNINNITMTRNAWYVSDTSIKISAAYQLSSTNTNTSYVIPLEILGINELAHGKQHDNSIKISHIYARLWSASNTALGGAQIILDGRDTVTVGSRDSAFTSCRVDFYAIDNTLLAQNDIPVGGGTFTAPANAYNVYIWGARSTAGQASISDIEIYKGE